MHDNVTSHILLLLRRRSILQISQVCVFPTHSGAEQRQEASMAPRTRRLTVGLGVALLVAATGPVQAQQQAPQQPARPVAAPAAATRPAAPTPQTAITSIEQYRI